MRHSLSISENPAEGHFTQGGRVHKTQLLCALPRRFTGIDFESKSCCPPGFRYWAGKREFYQVVRLFFTGRAMWDECVAGSPFAQDAQCLIQRSNASPYFVKIHKNNKLINMANAGCNRTRKGFFLSSHIRHASAIAVRQTKNTEITIAAITQPALYSASQKCMNIPNASRCLRRRSAIYCRFINYSTSLGGLKESFWFHHLIFMPSLHY
jgi:hypothetical protein